MVKVAMGNLCCIKKKIHRKIVLLLVGLDNAGKTAAAKGLAGESLESVVPTVGFSVVNLYYRDYVVKVFDLGGRPDIRGIWHRYFVYAHGVIFVVDSSDYSRMEEARNVLQDLLSHDKIAGKPVLLLANKQDQQEALDEIDLIEKLQLEYLVNTKQCPTLVESCSATDISSKSKLDPGIKKGYRWLLNYIIREYENINSRVDDDVKEQEIEDHEERLRKIERLKSCHQNNHKNVQDVDIIELYSEYDKKVNGNATKINEESLEQHSEVLFIQNTFINDSSSSVSSNSHDALFPHVYHSDVSQDIIRERPKSAVQLVKEQLELENVQRKPSFMTFFSNKTTPANLYGFKHPHSATERRSHVADRRNLKSAGDSTFYATELPNAVIPGSEADSLHQELLHLNHLHRSQRLPPLPNKTKVNNENEAPWISKPSSSKSVLSVVDIF